MKINLKDLYGTQLNSLHALMVAYTLEEHRDVEDIYVNFTGVSCTPEFWEMFMDHINPNDYKCLWLVNARYCVKRFKRSSVIVKRLKNE